MLQPYWLKHLTEYAASARPLAQLSPLEGFQLYGNEKAFLVPFICLAFYATAKKNKKKQTSALLIPAALTSVLAGITEPIDFTYLFAVPALWVFYSVMSATMNTVMYLFGIITYFVFKIMIEKFNYITPGREADDEDAKLINKKQYKQKMAAKAAGKDANDPYIARATAYLDLLGGASKITELSSCATRLRVSVADPSKVAPDSQFKANKAVNVVHHGKAIQVIEGLDVPQVLDEMNQLMQESGNDAKVSTEQDNPYIARATGIVDLLGGEENIKDVIACASRVRTHVFDTKKVAPDAEFKKIVDSYEVQHRDNNEIDIVVGLDADQVVD